MTVRENILSVSPLYLLVDAVSSPQGWAVQGLAVFPRLADGHFQSFLGRSGSIWLHVPTAGAGAWTELVRASEMLAGENSPQPPSGANSATVKQRCSVRTQQWDATIYKKVPKVKYEGAEAAVNARPGAAGPWAAQLGRKWSLGRAGG